jgi:hypothetical protein
MDCKDLVFILKHFGANLQPMAYWPPEKFEGVFMEQDWGSIAADYFNDLSKEMESKNYKNLYTAALVLFQNRKSFKDRLNGKISDDWLSKKTFGSIAQNCLEVLSLLPSRNLDQIALQKKFHEFI